MAIAIIVTVIVYLILSLTCFGLYNFICSSGDDEEEEVGASGNKNGPSRHRNGQKKK